MSATTGIQWTEATWNPVRGCSRVSPGCVNCYAERVAIRFAGRGKPFDGFVQITNGHPQWTGKVALVEKHLLDPLSWKLPRRVFVNSMADLFHESLPDEFIDRVFAVMALAPLHTFQVLTKRADRMLSYFSNLAHRQEMIGIEAERISGKARFVGDNRVMWPLPLPNVWLGVSVENQESADKRIPDLLATPAAIRLISYEPALGPVDLTKVDYRALLREMLADFTRRMAVRAGESDVEEQVKKARASIPDGDFSAGEGNPVLNALTGEWFDGWDSGTDGKKLDWIIVGGESGPGARPFDIEWARSVVRQCAEAGVACFVKQLGAKPFTSQGGASPIASENVAAVRLRDRKGGDMAEWPEDLRVREFPR